MTNLGIPLNTINIASLFFADDIVLIGKNHASMDKLMHMARDFLNQKLCLTTQQLERQVFQATKTSQQ